MTSGRQDDVDNIHLRASAHAEAHVYSLNNQYLTRPEKAQVEAWYQFPIGVFDYILVGYLALKGMDQYIPAFLIAFLASGVVGLINWFIPLRSVTVGFVFGGNVSTLIMLAFAGWFAYHGAWIAAVIAVAGAFGLLSIISPSMHLYTILSRRMHPKYWYAKRGFGITFPFEAYLDR